MSSFVQVYSITAGGSFKMPYNGFIAVASAHSNVTVGITIDGTIFNFEGHVSNGIIKYYDMPIPQGTIVNISHADAKVMAFSK